MSIGGELCLWFSTFFFFLRTLAWKVLLGTQFLTDKYFSLSTLKILHWFLASIVSSEVCCPFSLFLFRWCVFIPPGCFSIFSCLWYLTVLTYNLKVWISFSFLPAIFCGSVICRLYSSPFLKNYQLIALQILSDLHFLYFLCGRLCLVSTLSI